MADWLDILGSATDPDAPLTSELAKTWTDRPVALAEGASGAPRVQGQALGNVVVASGSIVTYLDAISEIDRAKTIIGDFICRGQSSSDLRIRLSNNNGSTWGSDQNLFSNEVFSGPVKAVVDVETGSYTVIANVSTGGGDSVITASGTITLPSGTVSGVGFIMTSGISGAGGVIMCVGGIS